MSERVSTYRGKIPAIIVVPHGFDDPNTSIVAEQIIEDCDAYGVINHGWERADTYDYYQDKANCNNFDHISQDVVKEEFLDPIVKYVDTLLDDEEFPSIFIIHGVSNSVRRLVNNDALDIIVGYGEGTPPSHSCELDFKDQFLQLLCDEGLRAYQGKAGGSYSARRKSNLNQLYRHGNYNDPDVFSLQLEIIRELREDEEIARITGSSLAKVISHMIEVRNGNRPNFVPTLKFPTI